MDQGLYEKHGLDVRFEDARPGLPGGQAGRRRWTVAQAPGPAGASEAPYDIKVDGWTPYMVRKTIEAREPPLIALASTDCVVRTHIIARPEIHSLEELKGKRIGVSYLRATTGFAALLLAERMGWDPVQDISIMLNGRDVAALRTGVVDAIVAAERAYADLKDEDYSILVETKEWNEPIAGNSVLVLEPWLEDPANRDAARRFLMATTEAIALFHQDRELALDVLARWNGVTDRDYGETMYDRGRWIPREPLPRYDGIVRTMELYDSNEMRRFAAEDFHDDSLMHLQRRRRAGDAWTVEFALGSLGAHRTAGSRPLRRQPRPRPRRVRHAGVAADDPRQPGLGHGSVRRAAGLGSRRRQVARLGGGARSPPASNSRSAMRSCTTNTRTPTA